MTVLRESFVLPAMFLTVALLGGLRIGPDVRLVPPPLVALILAMLLTGSLVRARVLLPGLFLGRRRTPLENLSGAVVLLSLVAASAQVFNLVTPERGLLHAIFSIFFFVLLLTTLAGVQERRPMLRSLVVLFGSAFALRFVVLESLYATDGGVLSRIMTAIVEGVSLGALQYQPNAPATGYVAFATLVIYLAGLFLLSYEALPPSEALAPRDRSTDAMRALVVLALLCAAGCGRTEAPHADPGQPAAGSGRVRAAVRDRALKGARVWRAPVVPVAKASLGSNPAGGFAETDEVSCRFVLKTVGGSTPKFNCELPDGEVVKVKYGATNAELHAEVAATRLLSALGFGADRMFVVRTVKCAGCPRMPFAVLRCLKETGLESACVPGGLDYTRIVEFETAVVERRLEGRVIEAEPDQGWAWFELDRVDPAAGGSSRAEVDALRLLAVLLAHWDNKAENQRLLCPPGRDRADGSCAAPLAMIQDLGATFGPSKVDLRNWRTTPIWADSAACRVSMEQMPFEGGTFPESRISEQGRQFLLELLDALSAAQLSELFTRSRITTFETVTGEGRDVNAWVEAFQDKVRQIREAGPCPSAHALTAAAAPRAGER